MKRLLLALAFFLVGGIQLTLSEPASAQAPTCRFFTETGGFNVCDDTQARFLSAFNLYGLQRVGYPISRRYERDGFVTQAFQKAIFQWRPDGNYVAFVNVFDELHNMGFDQRLLETRQTPYPLENFDPPGATFQQIVQTRQNLLNTRPAIRQAYFSVSDPLLFYGLPTSQVTDMGNHYAIRLQRAVLQEWKEAVPWAAAGQVTVANGADIAKELGALPATAIVPETGPTTPPPSNPPPANPPPSNPPPAQPTPPPGGQTGDLVITAVNKQAEYVDILNRGATPVNLAGWVLRSERGSQDCALGGTIAAGATLRVWAQTGSPGYSCGFNGPIWNNDESDPAVLIDPTGREVSRY